MPCIIEFESDDGDRLHERWPSIDAFLAFAVAEGLSGRWTAYAPVSEDAEGEAVRLDAGQL